MFNLPKYLLSVFFLSNIILVRVKETTQWGVSFTQLKPYVINETVIKIEHE